MVEAQLKTAWREARDWLFEEALPFWAEAGLDPAGGFHDQIDDDRRPVDVPKRLRVQGRQIFVFAEAGRLGWRGPWREAVRHGVAFLEAHPPVDGLYPTVFGRPDRGDLLYDQTFALLGLAHARRALDAPELDLHAQGYFEALRRRLGRADGGFNEMGAGETPLQANPNMHLYEALLAWRRVSDAPIWREAAAALRTVGRTVFTDPASGRIGEFFGDDGRPAPGAAGRIADPGHQFEWASLFMIDGAQDDAAAERLIRLATETGLDRRREVAVAAQDLDGTQIDRSARLWAQTERLRACLLFRGRSTEPDVWTAEAVQAAGAVRRYLDTPSSGLWRDSMDEQGVLDTAPVKASSLYHLMGGYMALWDAAEGRI